MYTYQKHTCGHITLNVAREQRSQYNTLADACNAAMVLARAFDAHRPDCKSVYGGQVPDGKEPCRFCQYHAGTIVGIKASSRHDSFGLPFAILTDDGNPVCGGGWRYRALFIDDLGEPRIFRFANLYNDECLVHSQASIETLCAFLEAAREHELRE